MSLRLMSQARPALASLGLLIPQMRPKQVVPLQPQTEEVARMLSMMREEALARVVDTSRHLVVEPEVIQEG